MIIVFRSEKIAFRPRHQIRLTKWVLGVVRRKKKIPVQIHFVFCSDAFLLTLNKKYLMHTTLTDIITFDYSVKKRIIGELYISVPRVKANAKMLKLKFEDELNRVMIHGVLHMLGYKDKSKADKKKIRNEEDKCLAILAGMK